MNYFVKYNDGFDLEFGGLKFNKNTDGFTGGKLYSDTLPVDIRKDGVFFIMPGTSLANAGMSGWITYSSLVIIGADASVRTDINFPAISANLTDGGSHLLWANLKFNMVSSSTAPIIRGNFGKFGDVVISDCSFPGIPKNFLNGDHVGSGQTHAVMDWNSVVIEDSELGFNSTGQTYLVMERGSVGSSIDKVTFDNNVFYCMKDITGIDFLLLHTNNSGKGLDVNEYTLTNNTLVFNNLNSNSSTVHALNKFVCDRNIFISDYTVNSNLVNVYKPDATTNPGTYPTEGQCTSNFYFDLDGSTDFPLLANSTILAAITRRGHPAELSASPLSALWEPENGKFGAYTITPVDPSKAPAAGVLIGAHRSDMTEESANVDSPSADYNSTDLGAL